MCSGRLVYSSDKGRVCAECGNPIADCVCGRESSAPVGDGLVRVSKETKGRKGKGVTVITGVPLASAELKKLAKALKARCGSGGTVKDGAIEIQGDHVDTLLQEMGKRGWEAKRSGG